MAFFKSFLTAVAFLAAVDAKVLTITAKSDNRFDPDTTKADIGDIVEFHFEPSNHSVVAGDYSNPCSPLPLGTGFYSGFVYAYSSGYSGEYGSEYDKVFRVKVNHTEPQIYYSSQANECADGMVGMINPSRYSDLEDYKSRASKLARGVTPGETAYGGYMVERGRLGNIGGTTDKSGSENDGKSEGKSAIRAGPENVIRNSAGMLKSSTLGVAGVFGVALYML